jgi:prepilin-type N-terminal cleavage/methylation domain-containing protein
MKHTRQNTHPKGTTLVEMLIVIVLIGILTTYTILKTYDSYEQGVVFMKKEMAQTMNKGLQTQYIRGFVMDDSYVQSLIPPTQDATAHYNALITLVRALQDGRKNNTTTYPLNTQIYTSESFTHLQENLESTRFRETSPKTGYLRLTGTDHKSLEVTYTKGETQP